MWVFDPTARRQLSHPSQEKSKKLKSTESKILELLLLNQGNVVTKECILQEVWGERIVSASSITQAIAQIRLALGDNGKEQHYIKTVPKQGYMLVVDRITFLQHNLSAGEGESNVTIAFSENSKKNKQHPKRSSFKAVNLLSLNVLTQCVLTACLSIGIFLISYWLITFYFHSQSITTKQWVSSEVAGISYYYESSPSGTKLFESISGAYQSNISKIFLSKNPEQIYISCIYKTENFSEIRSANLSFSHRYTTQNIKEAIREQCH
ncbi:winged helix-turn-helix domain-containing protein [Vibrio parahaemolyticus]|nr:MULTISPECIES: winged helix-turn-helix domain-containing protein [Vibrio harveyi group]MBS9854928.1 winged helix-turn-helix domain-containing protein [Vibrio alginolyticus]MCR9572500.1 winged helix-turn-helix domain-containing protein [Vibrio alginolyticus]MCS0084765.1 winged helix-turn-helix domain-containing protein [Vibrio alginolyticus]OUJ55033.1 transcriptional regulator [Vibrio parahaemolyticus]TOA32375.1 transcriptional regulator [Vibrio parahaemolyticus]